MESDDEACAMCKSYRRQLIEKDIAIKILTIRYQKIKDYVLKFDTDVLSELSSNLSNTNGIDVSKVSSSNCPTNFATSESASTTLKSRSSGVQNTNDFYSSNAEEDEKKAAHSELGSDYVFDQNFQMYYSKSTGYYYDEKSGLMYDPRSCVYYKYNYDTKTYEVYSENSSNQQNICDTVVNQDTSADQDKRFSDKQKKLLKQLKFNEILNRKVDMNKINLDVVKPWIAKRITDMLGGIEDDVVVEFVFNQLESEKYPDARIMQIDLTGFLDGKNAREFMAELWTLLISAEDSADGIPAAILEQKKDEIKRMVVNGESSDCCTDVKDEEKEDNVKKNPEQFGASDWLMDEGSNVTVADKVREVVNAHSKDFFYDSISKKYVIQSTGQYYDAERNLLYDPSTAAYYSYNKEEGKYEYYCQADPSHTVTKESSEKENVSKEERLKLRKQFWKKKLKEKDPLIQTKVEKSPGKISEEENSDENSSEKEFSSPEDGEIFSSDNESYEHATLHKPPVFIPSVPPQQIIDSELDVSAIPPAIRAIVVSSKRMQVGSLLLISADSRFIGRSKSNSVVLLEDSVSTVHAEIEFNTLFRKYSIQDLGSTNGTSINGHNISESKQKSGFFWLNHGDILSLGSCELLIHIHPELETCDGCEPGQVIAALSLLKDEDAEDKLVVLTKEEKEKQRREELRKIKKKYNLQGADFQRQLNSMPSKGYEDKAKIRRQTVGSDNPYEKTEQASVDRHIPKTNKGYQMLEKMGWKPGQALGAKGEPPERVPDINS